MYQTAALSSFRFGWQASRLSEADFQVLQRKASTAAANLVRKFRLQWIEREDLCQSLIVDALARLRSFDAGRGSFGGFVSTVVSHEAIRLSAAIFRERRIFAPISLDDPLDEGDGTVGTSVPEDSGYLALMGQPRDRISIVDARLDLLKLLRTLKHRDLALCLALIRRTPTELSRPAIGSRATIYRRLRKIRKKLTRSRCVKGVRRFSAWRVVPEMDITPTRLLSLSSPSVADFEQWLSTAAPGHTLEYFHGFLSIDTSPGSDRLPEVQRLEVLRIAHHAWLAAQRGRVHLVQRRIGDNVYSYLAVARPRETPTGVGTACRSGMPCASAPPTPSRI